MTKLYELMKEGRIVSKRVDGIRLINLAWTKPNGPKMPISTAGATR